MIKRVLALVGFLLLLAGLFGGRYLFVTTSQAQALDNKDYPGEITGNLCYHPRPVIELSSRTMSENDTQALRVHLSNTSNKACTVSVTLDAPNFDIGTLSATRSVTLPPHSDTTQLAWVISPKRTGSFQITVQSGLDTDVVGLVVLNVLGFAPWQVQIFSIVSTIFGPMLTAPWWFEQFKSRQTKKRR